MLLKNLVEQAAAGDKPDAAQTERLFSDVLAGRFNDAQLAALLGALAAIGPSAEQIEGAARALRSAMVPFEHPFSDALDTCGTGGSGLCTFNVSTVAALVAAGAGARVIKHGNRAASSSCGSADVLEAAGVRLEVEPDVALRCLEETGFTFLFAPAHHPALSRAAGVRRQLGVPTLFNLLGPLANPGRVRRQLLGTARPELLPVFAGVLERLGCDRGIVVHGAGGADELTLMGPNAAQAVGDLGCPLRFQADALGLTPAPVAALRGGDVHTNLRMLREVLGGERGPLRDSVLLNATAALVIADVADTADEALERARTALDSGAARSVLDRVVQLGAVRSGAQRAGGAR